MELTGTALVDRATEVAAALTAGAQPPHTPPPSPAAPATLASAAPVITRIDFHEQIPADGNTYYAWVSFTDADGDVNHMHVDVLRSVSMKGGEGDPTHSLQGAPTAGRYHIHVWCYRAQEVTERITLFDAAGNSSNSMDFSFACYKV